MSAQATAALTVKVGVVGAESLNALAGSLQRLGAAGARAANGNARAAQGSAKAIVGSAEWSARSQLRLMQGVNKTASVQAAKQARDAQAMAREQNKWNEWVERQKLNAAKVAHREHEKSVRAHMAVVQKIAREQAREDARNAAGPFAGILRGHGFINPLRQGAGFMRDLTIGAMGVRYAFGAAAAGIGAITRPVIEFEKLLADVKNKGGFNAAEMSAIAATAKTLGKTSMFSATQAAGASVELAAAGLDAGGIEKGLPSVLRFAQASGLSTESASAVMVESMSQFGLAASDFERIGNAMVKGANMSTISVADMSESLKYVGPIAASAGMDIEQTAATIALLGERGLKGSMGGTGLRTMLASLVQPAKQAKKAMAEVGLSKADMQAGLGDLPGFMKMLSEKMEARGFTDAQRLSVLKRMFGTEGMTAADILMKAATQQGTDGKTAWAKYTDGVRDAKTAMKDAAEVSGNTLAGKMQKLHASIESAQISLGERLVPVLSKAIPKLAAAAVTVGDWIGKNEDLVSNLAVLTPALAGTSYAASGLATAFSGIAKVSGALGVTMGMPAGAAFGTSFIGAALPVIAAGIAGFGIGTLLAKALHMEIAGKTIYELLHGETEKKTERGFKKAKPDLAKQFKKDMDDPILASLFREQSGVDDPVLRGIRGDAPAAIAAHPWSGLMKIEIDNKGKATVKDLKIDGQGPALKVGVNMGNDG